MKKTYKVGEHCFSVNTESSSVASLLSEMKNYVPFLCGNHENISCVFNLDIFMVESVDHYIKGLELLAEFDDDIAYISLMSDKIGNNAFRISLNKELCNYGGLLVIDDKARSVSLYLIDSAEVYLQQFIVNNSLMLLYAMYTSTLDTLLVHASVVINDNGGYAFLGRSGTGKSTHTRLWLKYIGGSVLLNDDNPVIRVLSEGKAMIYGSPWSGKTPCYKNEFAPLRAIVRLSQAPYNKITSLKGITAYAAVAPSASSMKWNKSIADGLHVTLSKLINSSGVYHLECLPDEAAAQLCFNTVK